MREGVRSEVGERERDEWEGERERDLERVVESERDVLRRGGDRERLRLALRDLEREGERLGAGDRSELDRSRGLSADGDAAPLSRAPPPFAALCDDMDPRGRYSGSLTSSSELELRLGDLLCLLRRRDTRRGFRGVEAGSAGRGAAAGWWSPSSSGEL